MPKRRLSTIWRPAVNRCISFAGATTSTYDAANRLTSAQFSNGTAVARFDYAYDNNNNVTGLTRYSNLASTSVVGTTVYQYDNADRLVTLQNKNCSGGVLNNYTYAYRGGATTKVFVHGAPPRTPVRGRGPLTTPLGRELIEPGKRRYGPLGPMGSSDDRLEWVLAG